MMNTVKRCRVCGDSATGFHYRGLCCESCKIFFHRYAHKKLVCTFGGKCIINIKTRKFCQCCRLKACLQNGMIKGKEVVKRNTQKKVKTKQNTENESKKPCSENDSSKEEQVFSGFFDSVLETAILKNITLFDVEVSKQNRRSKKSSKMISSSPETPLQSHTLFGNYESSIISTLKEALSVFGDENACQKEQIAVSLRQFYHMPEIYVRWTVKFVKRLPAFAGLNSSDQFILFKPFSYNILVIRLSFCISPQRHGLRVFANNEADEVIFYNFNLGKHIKHSEAWKSMVNYGQALSQEMEGDQMIRDLLTAQLLFTPTPNRAAENDPKKSLSCREFVHYQQSLYLRLLRRHLQVKYRSRAVAMRKYSNLLGLISRLTTFKETEIYLYQAEYGNIQELSELELEMYNLT